MLTQPPSFEFQIKFLKYIQWLLESSSYTSSYKFALLMSLVNISIESGIQDNRSYFVSYEQLAKHFINLYWGQALPYAQDKTEKPHILSQNTGGRAAIIRKILDVQQFDTNINNARLIAGDKAWSKLNREVAETIRKYPAKHLQTIEEIKRTFLYQYDETNTKGIELNPGVTYCLAHYSTIVYKLCQQYWTEFVKKRNPAIFANELDLQEFLFGESRQALVVLRPMLIEIQQNRCFYCQAKLQDNFEVDHFIPWSKYHNDTAHNFVLADNKCNNSKRDYLAHERFFELWLIRNQRHGDTIHSYSREKGFVSNLATSIKIGQWAYQIAVNNGDIVWSPQEPKLQVIDNTFNPYLSTFS